MYETTQYTLWQTTSTMENHRFNGKTENSLFRLGYVQELFVCLPEGIQYIGDDHHQVWEILLASF